MAEIKFGFTARQIIEDGRITEEDIDLVKSWLATQELPILTNEQIVLFLLSCNNDQHQTQETINSYYAIRKNSLKLFSDRKMDRNDIQKQLKTYEFCIFPEKTSEGYAIVFCRLQDTYYGNAVPEVITKLCFMTLDAVVYDHPPKGVVVLCDLKGTGLMHLTRVKLGLTKIFFDYIQRGMPVKVKQVHILNTVYFMDKLMGLIKPFVKKEIFEMVHFHSPSMDMELFYKNWVPKRCLPEDYGGDLPPVRVLHQQNIQKLLEMESYFEAEELQRCKVQSTD